MDYTCVMLKALFLCLLPVNIHVSVAKQLPLNPTNCAAARAYTCTKSSDQQTRTTVIKLHSTTYVMQSSE